MGASGYRDTLIGLRSQCILDGVEGEGIED